jgi:hypothetical protein
VLWLLLAGFFVVCHGCHGDEDNELSAPLDTHLNARTIADETPHGATPQPQAGAPN